MMEVVKKHNYLFHLDMYFVLGEPYFTLPVFCGNLPCGFQRKRFGEVSPSTRAATLKSDIVQRYLH